jgi:hypothetical protein
LAGAKAIIRNERGGALPVALAAAVFLTLLGMVLLGTVRHSLAQSAGSEAKVRAEALAQMGIDEAFALIRAAVRQANGDAATGYTYRQKVVRTQTELGSLHAFLDGYAAEADRGSYRLDIMSDTDNYDAFQDNVDAWPRYPYSRLIVIRSTGKAGEWQTRTVTLERTFVISTVNPVFRYPVSGKEHLVLNGAVTVIGDILARNGSISTTNKARFIGLPGSDYAKESDFPAVQGFYREHDPKTKQFSAAIPFEDRWMPLDADISVEDMVQAHLAELDAAMPVAGTGIAFDELHAWPLPAVVSMPLRLENQWVEVAGPSAVSGDLAVKDGVLTLTPAAQMTVGSGSVYVDFPSPLWAAADLSGMMTLDPGEALVVRGDAVIGDGFKFRGILAVSGNLTIVGSVNVDGTIMAGGDVELKQTKEINREAGWTDKPLILLAGGKIHFSDARPDGEPAELRAFLYSEEDMQLYGVQTKLVIRGGVHGKTVTLNAVREGDEAGKTDTWFEGTVLPGEAAFTFTPTEIQKTLGMDRSNLQIRHDDRLYADPPAGIPVTEDVTAFMKIQ